MSYQEIMDYLYAHADARYAAFSSSLIPGEQPPMIGVRLPLLRNLARRLAKEDWRAYLDEAVDDTFEEIMLQGFVTGLAKMPFEEQMRRMTSYAGKITNWSLCDSPCAGFKFVRKHQEEVWEFLQPYLYCQDEFRQRFGIIMLMDHFMDDRFIFRFIDVLGSVRPVGYYASMAVAWAVSTCYVRYPELIMDLLRSRKLDKDCQNRAIQKIVDSLRITADDKNKVKALKIK